MQAPVESHARPLTILALASEVKGLPFIEECRRQGCHLILLINEQLRSEAWPWDCIAEHHTLRDIRVQPDVTVAVTRLARSRRIDQIVALDDYDVETVGMLREHLRLGGMGYSAALLFRDKLAMRVRAQERGVLQPRFTGVFNADAVREFVSRVPAPWVLKPRTLAGSEGIRTFHRPGELQRALEELGDRCSHHLLEEFVRGDVYHVDGLVWQGRVDFALASRYGAPPMSALQGRGVFSTRNLALDSSEATALHELNERVVVEAMQRSHGPTHTEFIRDETGRFHFLETAARVAGGYIEKLVEAASGIALWQEAARMELALLRGVPYTVPATRSAHAGLIAAPSRFAYPDTSAYEDPEIFYRPRSREFVSLIVRSADSARVDELLTSYARRFRNDFMS
jgi:hypothetical protein